MAHDLKDKQKFGIFRYDLDKTSKCGEKFFFRVSDFKRSVEINNELNEKTFALTENIEYPSFKKA